jgi:hypothetical protein
MLELVLIVIAILSVGFIAGLLVRKAWVATWNTGIGVLAGCAITLILIIVLEAL